MEWCGIFTWFTGWKLWVVSNMEVMKIMQSVVVGMVRRQNAKLFSASQTITCGKHYVSVLAVKIFIVDFIFEKHFNWMGFTHHFFTTIPWRLGSSNNMELWLTTHICGLHKWRLCIMFYFSSVKYKEKPGIHGKRSIVKSQRSVHSLKQPNAQY